MMRKNYMKMKKNNPEFICEIFGINSGRQFIAHHFGPALVEAYNRLRPYAYKSDLFRYCYMYIYGGVYVDIKYESMNGFKFIELTNKEYLVSEPMGVQNCLMALMPRNKIMLECINKIMKNALLHIYEQTSLFTGPVLITDKYKQIYGKNRIDIDLVWRIKNDIHVIHKFDRLILRQYSEYRSDLMKTSDQPHYNEMFMRKEIYN